MISAEVQEVCVTRGFFISRRCHNLISLSANVRRLYVSVTLGNHATDF